MPKNLPKIINLLLSSSPKYNFHSSSLYTGTNSTAFEQAQLKELEQKLKEIQNCFKEERNFLKALENTLDILRSEQLSHTIFEKEINSIKKDALHFLNIKILPAFIFSLDPLIEAELKKYKKELENSSLDQRQVTQNTTVNQFKLKNF